MNAAALIEIARRLPADDRGLAIRGVRLEGMSVKPNMVLPGLWAAECIEFAATLSQGGRAMALDVFLRPRDPATGAGNLG